MRIMTRMGRGALEVLGTDGEFVPCLHSVGAPLADGEADVPWPCDAENKYIVHFPETREIWSYGSGYGGNALLGKKCFALRIASVMARDDNWLAEHMLILKLTSPAGETRYVTGAFPSACGKTNLAMLIPTLPDWKVETVGDDICWMKFGADGRLYAINPEAGFFGVAPGTNTPHQPQRHADHGRQRHLHQHRPHRRRRRVVGGDDRRAAGPPHLVEGRGLDARVRHPGRPPERPLHRPGRPGPGHRLGVGGPGRRAHRRHPLRRPPGLGGPAGVPVPGLAARRVPRLDHGLGDDGGRGRRRRQPAPRPLRHAARSAATTWPTTSPTGSSIGAGADPDKLPKIFYVNWFRKDEDGRWLWPGYGENSRVLEWVFERVSGKGEATETPIGFVPAPGAIDTDGLDVSEADMDKLLTVDTDEWRAEVPVHPRALRHLRRQAAGRAGRRGRRAGARSWADRGPVAQPAGRAARSGPGGAARYGHDGELM